MVERCDWATCREPEAKTVDGWRFCAAHLRLHEALETGLVEDLEEELRDAQEGARVALARVTAARAALAEAYQARGIKRRLPLLECGSHAAYVRHQDQGEQPCVACEEGERIYQAEAHRKRKAVRHSIA